MLFTSSQGSEPRPAKIERCHFGDLLKTYWPECGAQQASGTSRSRRTAIFDEELTVPGSLTSSITATFSDPVTGEKAAYEEFVERGGFAARFVMPALAKPLAETAFDEWLGACNRDGRAALTGFNAQRFGEPEQNIDGLLDSREESAPAARMRGADDRRFAHQENLI